VDAIDPSGGDRVIREIGLCLVESRIEPSVLMGCGVLPTKQIQVSPAARAYFCARESGATTAETYTISFEKSSQDQQHVARLLEQYGGSENFLLAVEKTIRADRKAFVYAIDMNEAEAPRLSDVNEVARPAASHFEGEAL